MNLKLIFFVCGVCLASLFLVFTVDVAAQKKQRITLKKTHGESGAAVEGIVSGTIAGDTVREFVFRARKGRGMDLNLDTESGDAVSFAVVEPNGKIMIKDTTNMLDDAEQTGDYTIRVYILNGKAASKKKSAFRFSVFMYV